MIKRMIIVVGALALVFGGIFAWKSYQADQLAKMRASGGAPAAVVSSTQAIAEQWQDKINAVGGLNAIQGVEVSSEVPGKVTKINFRSGHQVNAGMLLVQLDASEELAELKSLEAELELARLDHERAERLVKRGAVSQAQLDRAASEMAGLAAQVEEQKALIAKKSIRAPFSGELGIRMVDIGEFVSPGTEIVTLQNLSPIYTDFTLPERFMSALKPEQTIEVEVAAFPGETFTGTVTAISPKVDQMTRTVRLQATLENKDRRLRPGMFASIDVVTGTGSDVVTVPRTAVTFYPYGDSAFVINGDGDDLTVERRQIKTGRVRAGQIEILSGLQAGDRVVSAGQLKLRTGQKIRIDNSIALPENVTGP